MKLLKHSWIISLLIVSSIPHCRCAMPTFLWSDDELPERKLALEQAFKDAIEMARVVAMTYNSCEEVSGSIH